MQTYLNIAEITISVVLIITILLQLRGMGGGLFASGEATFRTRRGLEKTLFQFTIILTVVFILISLASASRFIPL